MQAGASAYEVRCPRCDVSFPVGTRRCLHCGGPTTAAAAGAVPTVTPGPFERSAEEEASAGDEGAAGGFGGSLLRISGSLFWIVALVLFSILRNCGER